MRSHAGEDAAEGRTDTDADRAGQVGGRGREHGHGRRHGHERRHDTNMDTNTDAETGMDADTDTDTDTEIREADACSSSVTGRHGPDHIPAIVALS